MLFRSLRNNGGGYVNEAIAICRLIVPEGPIIYMYDKATGKTPVMSELQDAPFQKIVVLTNKQTASSSEIIVSALQDSGAAVVVGTTTFGKALTQELFEYVDGSSFKLTTQEWFRRNGQKLNGIGATPDIPVHFVGRVVTEASVTEEYRPAYTQNLNAALALLNAEDVRTFQIRNGIPQTGTVNDATANALNRAVETYYYENDIALQAAYQALMQ